MIKETKKYSADEERTLLAALILHSKVLGRVLLHLQGNEKPFRSLWSNLVAGWCFKYHRRYGKAPRRNIQRLFAKYAAASPQKETVEMVEAFLSGLSEDFGSSSADMNEDYLVDLASAYFRQIKLERTMEEMQDSLDRDDVDEAEAALKNYSSLSFGTSDWVNPFDPKVIVEALQENTNQELVRFPGAVGEFLTPHFERDGFISFVGPEKRGKSFWLQEVVWQALIQRRRVLYYVVGDMSQRQVMRRLATRALRRPMYPGKIRKPVIIDRVGKDKVEVRYKTKHYSEHTSLTEAVKSLKLMLQKTGAAASRLKLKCCGGASLTASDIEKDVVSFFHEGWPVDLVVVDYADLLAPEAHSKSWDYRHQINESWKIMRRISQDHHLLFVTATQAASSSYDTYLVRKKDFSEDKRKNAHVTGMLGINQTSEEKEQGIYRLNWVFLRDGRWTDSQVVWAASCLSYSCPCVVSTL